MRNGSKSNAKQWKPSALTPRALGINPRALGISPRDLNGLENDGIALKLREAAKILLELADEFEGAGE